MILYLGLSIPLTPANVEAPGRVQELMRGLLKPDGPGYHTLRVEIVMPEVPQVLLPRTPKESKYHTPVHVVFQLGRDIADKVDFPSIPLLPLRYTY
jgi:hypothetical protein